LNEIENIEGYDFETLQACRSKFDQFRFDVDTNPSYMSINRKYSAARRYYSMAPFSVRDQVSADLTQAEDEDEAEQ